jgi:uncharacterized protein (TIGR03435 family)
MKTDTRRTLSWIAPILAAVLLTSALAQPGAPARFEVTSVRPSDGTVFRSEPLTVTDPLIRLKGYTIYGLILDAYHVRDFQVGLSPDIPKDEVLDRTYDIVARAPGVGVPKTEDVRVMLQNMLADRFHLKAHHEMKEMQVYALVVDRGRAKLKEAAAGARCSIRMGSATGGRNTEVVISACPIERLADHLGNMMGNRAVLDQTGLGGQYDFRLVAIPEYRVRGGSDPADIDPRSAVAELGLKLVPQKAQVDVIAVDHVERPTEN